MTYKTRLFTYYAQNTIAPYNLGGHVFECFEEERHHVNNKRKLQLEGNCAHVVHVIHRSMLDNVLFCVSDSGIVI